MDFPLHERLYRKRSHFFTAPYLRFGAAQPPQIFRTCRKWIRPYLAKISSKNIKRFLRKYCLNDVIIFSLRFPVDVCWLHVDRSVMYQFAWKLPYRGRMTRWVSQIIKILSFEVQNFQKSFIEKNRFLSLIFILKIKPEYMFRRLSSLVSMLNFKPKAQ